MEHSYSVIFLLSAVPLELDFGVYIPTLDTVSPPPVLVSTSNALHCRCFLKHLMCSPTGARRSLRGRGRVPCVHGWSSAVAADHWLYPSGHCIKDRD